MVNNVKYDIKYFNYGDGTTIAKIIFENNDDAILGLNKYGLCSDIGTFVVKGYLQFCTENLYEKGIVAIPNFTENNEAVLIISNYDANKDVCQEVLDESMKFITDFINIA